MFALGSLKSFLRFPLKLLLFSLCSVTLQSGTRQWKAGPGVCPQRWLQYSIDNFFQCKSVCELSFPDCFICCTALLKGKLRHIHTLQFIYLFLRIAFCFQEPHKRHTLQPEPLDFQGLSLSCAPSCYRSCDLKKKKFPGIDHITGSRSEVFWGRRVCEKTGKCVCSMGRYQIK